MPPTRAGRVVRSRRPQATWALQGPLARRLIGATDGGGDDGHEVPTLGRRKGLHEAPTYSESPRNRQGFKHDQ